MERKRNAEEISVDEQLEQAPSSSKRSTRTKKSLSEELSEEEYNLSDQAEDESEASGGDESEDEFVPKAKGRSSTGSAASSSSTPKAKAPKAPKAPKEPKAPKVKKPSMKQFNDVLKYCTEAELKSLLQRMSHIPQVFETVTAFQPDRMPVQVDPNDYWLHHCFHCSDATQLQPFEDIKICSGCYMALYGPPYGGTMTREKLMEYFPFTKKEADAIPRQATVGGFYRSKVYVYQLTNVIRAAKKKWGSLYLMKKHT